MECSAWSWPSFVLGALAVAYVMAVPVTLLVSYMFELDRRDAGKDGGR